MKKWITFLLIFVLAFVFVGCDDPKETTITPNIVIEGSVTTMDINAEVQLSATVSPANASSKAVVWSSDDETILTVDQTGNVVAIAAGTATITVASKDFPTVKKTVTITVNAAFADPESVELTGSEQVSIGSFIQMNVSVLPEGASQNVTYSSSDTALATVDDAGKVWGVAEGTVTITATVVADMSLTDTHDVLVVPRGTPDPGDLEPTQVIIEGSDKLFEGTNIELTANVLPQGVSQNVTWTSSNLTIATVNETGVVTGLKEGTSYITATTVKNTEIFAMFKVTVSILPPPPEYPDLGGYVINIMAAPHATQEHDPFLEGYAAADKVAKQEAWLYVEEEFNCDLQVIPFPIEAPWGGARINWLNEKAALGAAETDIFVSTTDWVKQLADGNSIVDVSDFYDLYGKNQMGASTKAAGTYQEGLYVLPTANVAGINVDKGLFYNVDLVNSLGLESPAKLFNDGEWTYDGFSDYVKAAAPLLGTDQTVLSGKPAYFYMGMVNAAGVKLADTLSLQMNFNNAFAVETAGILRDLYLETGWGTNAWDAGATTFNEGNSIFQSGEYWFVNEGNRWPSNIWDEGGNSKFGYVPYPYPDEMSRDDTRTVGAGGACYMQAAGRVYPAGVDAEGVFWAFTEMMLKTGEIMKDDPSFDEETTMRNAAEAKFADPESVTAIVFFRRNKVVFDPLYGLLDVSSNIGTSMDQIVIEGADYNEVMDTLSPLYLARMLELYS